MTHRRWARVLLFGAVLVAPQVAFGQAIMGTIGGSNQALIFPSPNTGLPSPAEVPATPLPVGALPQGVSYFGSDSALVSDFQNSRVFVIKISTAAVTATIPTSPSYDGTGTIAVAPGLTAALASGTSGATGTLAVIAAPFNASSTITTVALPGTIKAYQTQAIVFNAAGRAFVYTTAGISVLDPPYSSISFTIPASNSGSGAIAITPDGNTLLTTNLLGGNVDIYTAPFSSSSTAATLVAGGTNLDGIAVTPDGLKALVASAGINQLLAISAPFTTTSTVESIPISAVFGSNEDVGISADGQLAILAGNTGINTHTAFIRAPFTAVGATVFDVTVPGGRGAGSVRFLPPGLAAGLTINKSAPANVSSGANLTYTITYGNTGGAAASGVVIKDTVPAGTTFVSATGGGTLAGGVVTWNIGTVNSGVTGQTVSFTVTVNSASGNVDNSGYTIEATGVPPIPGPPVTTTIGGVAPTPTPIPTRPPTAVAVPLLDPRMTLLLVAGIGLTALFLLRRS